MSDTQTERGRVTPLELFFDLVFVFAITQVTTFLSHEPTWNGLLRGALLRVRRRLPIRSGGTASPCAC